MSLSYDQTWEVMNGLEDSFNRIVTLDFMVQELAEAVNNDDKQSIIDLVAAIQSYMTIYIRQYEKASKVAWDNTVKKLFDEKDNPYRRNWTPITFSNTDLNYEEVEKFFEDESDFEIYTTENQC
tara:strand:+ start:275 stop:646 length:372 start_codon:yes stop_codon:yes gene_type:complete